MNGIPSIQKNMKNSIQKILIKNDEDSFTF